MEDGLIVEAEAGREGNAPLDRPAYLGDALAEILDPGEPPGVDRPDSASGSASRSPPAGLQLCRQDASGGAGFHEERIRLSGPAGAHGRSTRLRVDDGCVARTAMVMRAANAEAGPQGR